MLDTQDEFAVGARGEAAERPGGLRIQARETASAQQQLYDRMHFEISEALPRTAARPKTEGQEGCRRRSIHAGNPPLRTEAVGILPATAVPVQCPRRRDDEIASAKRLAAQADIIASLAQEEGNRRIKAQRLVDERCTQSDGGSAAPRVRPARRPDRRRAKHALLPPGAAAGRRAPKGAS